MKKWETKSCLSLAIYAWNFRTDTFFFLLGYPKAEYAIGYFTEMGIGCRRDPLEANVWYVRAADQGDEKARQRLQIIQDAASGGMRPPQTPIEDKKKKGLLSKFR